MGYLTAIFKDWPNVCTVEKWGSLLFPLSGKIYEASLEHKRRLYWPFGGDKKGIDCRRSRTRGPSVGWSLEAVDHQGY